MIRRFTADAVTLSCSAALRIEPVRATSSTYLKMRKCFIANPNPMRGASAASH
jgi:hypothetical protein